MPKELKVRTSIRDDIAAIEALYPVAFPDEDLLPVVRDLLQEPAIVTSLVGSIDERIVGHAIFTQCSVTGSSVKAALLAPLGVEPAWQGYGIGTAIVRAGLHRMEEAGVSLVFVLGDPEYYKRLGFVAETSIEPPYPLPSEWQAAWQSQVLGSAEMDIAGKLSVPRPWRRPELWRE